MRSWGQTRTNHVALTSCTNLSSYYVICFKYYLNIKYLIIVLSVLNSKKWLLNNKGYLASKFCFSLTLVFRPYVCPEITPTSALLVVLGSTLETLWSAGDLAQLLTFYETLSIMSLHLLTVINHFVHSQWKLFPLHQASSFCGSTYTTWLQTFSQRPGSTQFSENLLENWIADQSDSRHLVSPVVKVEV